MATRNLIVETPKGAHLLIAQAASVYDAMQIGGRYSLKFGLPVSAVPTSPCELDGFKEPKIDLYVAAERYASAPAEALVARFDEYYESDRPPSRRSPSASPGSLTGNRSRAA